MEEITPQILFTVFKEMFGVMIYPLVFISLFIVFAFVLLLIFEKRVICKRAVAAFVVGLIFGIVGLFVFKSFSISPSVIVISSPVDLMLLSMNYFGSVFAVTILVYTFIGWMGTIKKSGCPIDKKLR
ncbi:MAG: DUF5368 family protein [Campylobacteraceae bacterium]